MVHVRAETREEILGVCDVLRVQETTGAPEQCQPVVIFAPDQLDNPWVNVVMGYKYTAQRVVGRPDFSLKIYSEHLTERRILQASQQALRTHPLSFTNIKAKYNRGALQGWADYRFSLILSSTWSKWYEIVTINIDIGKNDGRINDDIRSNSVFDIEVTTTLLVSRQNTDRHIDYTHASEIQNKTYVEIVQDILKKSITTLCKSLSWEDNYTFSCH
jgi:hypothetical protein